MNAPTGPTGRDQDRALRRGPRVDFTFDGDLEDVPVDAAETLARVAHILVTHSDQHAGRAAAVRITRIGRRLRLDWADPECSSACLRRAGGLGELEGLPVSASGGVRLLLHDPPHGGLRLEWTLLRTAMPATRSWIPFVGRGRGRSLGRLRPRAPAPRNAPGEPG